MSATVFAILGVNYILFFGFSFGVWYLYWDQTKYEFASESLILRIKPSLTMTTLLGSIKDEAVVTTNTYW